MTSSPAIGSDDTVYVGSDDHKLYAINPDGTQKWEFGTGSLSPAIGADGTVYVGAHDGKLHAINPNGTKKWTFGEVLVEISDSCPAIGADGTVYVSSWQGFYKNYIFAIYPDGTKKWELPGHFLVTAPAIGSDGTIYAGAYAKLFAVQGGTVGLAASPWPKFRHDSKNSGNVGN